MATPKQAITAALKADQWVNPGKAAKTALDALAAEGFKITGAGVVDADGLSADVDLSMTCVGLAIGAAGAMLTGDEAAEGMAAILELWPESVADVALVVGARVALSLSTAVAHMDDGDAGLDAETLGTIAATILDTNETTETETE